MIRRVLNFIFQNDGTSMLPIVGDYLITLFVVFYNFWFALLIKISNIFIAESYLMKTIIAFASFFITIYTLLYVIRKLVAAFFRIIFFIIIKMLSIAFGSFLNKIIPLKKKFLQLLNKPIEFLKITSKKSSKNNLTQPPVIAKDTKMVPIQKMEVSPNI